MPRLEIQQDAPILASNEDEQFEFESPDNMKRPAQGRAPRSARTKTVKYYKNASVHSGHQSVSNLFNGELVEDSHPDCDFCGSQFDLLDQSQCLIMKKKMLRQSSGAVRDKEEEFFRMCLLSFQLTNAHNQKILALDS